MNRHNKQITQLFKEYGTYDKIPYNKQIKIKEFHKQFHEDYILRS